MLHHSETCCSLVPVHPPAWHAELRSQLQSPHLHVKGSWVEENVKDFVPMRPWRSKLYRLCSSYAPQPYKFLPLMLTYFHALRVSIPLPPILGKKARSIVVLTRVVMKAKFVEGSCQLPRSWRSIFPLRQHQSAALQIPRHADACPLAQPARRKTPCAEDEF